jgi:Ca2+-binding EF-hand superfamily protein
VTNLINDALKQMKQKKKVTEEEVNQFIRSVDTDNDAKINKKELFEIFKKVITNGR